MYLFSITLLSLFNCLVQINKINCIQLDQKLLFESYGYSKDSTAIDLTDQNIDSIEPNTFEFLTNLEYLNFKNNKLTRIDSRLFKNLSNLKVLNLESNSIISFEKTSLIGLNNLEQVCIFNNPVSIMFANTIKDICSTNPRCTLKIKEPCSEVLTTTQSTTVIPDFSCKLFRIKFSISCFYIYLPF